jgi:hypothetical protein
MLQELISSAKEWYGVYDELSHVMKGSPLNKEKFLYYLNKLHKTVKNARESRMKNNKDTEWSDLGLDMYDFLYSGVVEFGLKNGVTLEEMKQVKEDSTEEDSIKEDSTNEDKATTSTEDTNPESLNTAKTDTRVDDTIQNDILKQALDEMMNDYCENTVEKVMSVSMNKTPDETVWYVSNRHIVSDSSNASYFNTDTIWLVISLLVSLFMGFRYLSVKKE